MNEYAMPAKSTILVRTQNMSYCYSYQDRMIRDRRILLYFCIWCSSSSTDRGNNMRMYQLQNYSQNLPTRRKLSGCTLHLSDRHWGCIWLNMSLRNFTNFKIYFTMRPIFTHPGILNGENTVYQKCKIVLIKLPSASNIMIKITMVTRAVMLLTIIMITGLLINKTLKW